MLLFEMTEHTLKLHAHLQMMRTIDISKRHYDLSNLAYHI